MFSLLRTASRRVDSKERSYSLSSSIEGTLLLRMLLNMMNFIEPASALLGRPRKIFTPRRFTSISFSQKVSNHKVLKSSLVASSPRGAKTSLLLDLEEYVGYLHIYSRRNSDLFPTKLRGVRGNRAKKTPMVEDNLLAERPRKTK